MARNVQTRNAELALGRIIRDDVAVASPTNDIVSIPESATLDPFVRRSAVSVRADKPKYGRVRSDDVIEPAIADAMAKWRRVNPQDGSRNALYFSRAEIRELEGIDPELAALSMRAYNLARGDAAGAVRGAIEARPDIGALLHRNSSFGTRIDASVGQPGRDELPDAVRSAFDIHYRVEAADLGAATLKTFSLGGSPVYALYGTTDGDDQRLELFDLRGTPLASGRFFADRFTHWDAHFGLGRFASVVGLRGHPVVDGYSEDDEARAAGQVTRDWQPEVVVRDGTLHHSGGVLTGFDTDTALTPAQDEVVRATLELAYRRTVQAAAAGLVDPDLADFGAIRVGMHQDNVDGQTYIVGHWANKDDASFKFYFQRDEHHRLFVAREQSDG